MDLKNKKTTLTDEAEIYRHSENVSEKEKWKAMSGKKRWEYFRQYYMLKVIVLIACVGGVGAILYSILAPKPETVLSVAIVNGAMYYDTCEEVELKFSEYIELDSDKQQVKFDTAYDLLDATYETRQKFTLSNALGDLDITIMPQSVFDTYAPNGFFSPVTEYLPADLYGELSEYLVESQQMDEDGNLIPDSETIYGIRIDSTWPYQGETFGEPIILSINLSPSNVETIETFLRFLFFSE